MPTQGLRVFLADDHVIVRQCVKTILERRGCEVVGEASDGHAAVELCAELQPAVAILDIRMPLVNGIDAAEEILKHSPATRVVLLTMHPGEAYVSASLRAGISGYVLKTDPASSLLEAIEAASTGKTYLSAGLPKAVANACLSNDVPRSGPLCHRERQVLQLIAEGKSVKEIGWLLGISGGTAETYRVRIMQKLNIYDTAGLVKYAVAHGLIAVADEAA